MDIASTIGLFASLMTVIIGLFQWSLTAAQRRQAEIGRQRDAQIDKLYGKLTTMSNQHQEFKDEVHRDFARRELITALAGEIRDDMKQLFEKFDNLSTQLNQIVGAMGRRKNDQ